MQTTRFPATVPKISFPAWPGAVERRKWGMSAYSTQALCSISWAKGPKEVPRIKATSGAKAIFSFKNAAISWYSP